MTIPTHIGRYEVLGLLGTGGMAEVFLGRIIGPAGFKRPVVIKRILPHLARQQSFVDMFLDEARIVARIRHGNVVQVQELCQEGEQLYLVMEYLEGESLDGIVRRLISHRRLLEYGLATHIIAEIASGLHAAHELTDENGLPQNLVHRDVSPANIFVTYDGQVKILDFGIATAADRLSRTSAGQVKGKYPYMSPEQCRGFPLDRRSDVFSLGIVLFELTTCRRLFKRVTEVETATAIAAGIVPLPSTFIPGYPAEVEAIVFKALQVDMEQRYRNTLEMRRELVEVTHREGKGPHVGERLATVMQRLFEDRVAEKRAMLSKVAAGEQVSAVPSAETDQAVVIPDAAAPGSNPTNAQHNVLSASPLAEQLTAPPRKLGISIGGSLAVAGIFGAIVLAWIGLRGPDAPPQPPPPDPAHLEKTAPVKKFVEIEVITEPDGAKVSIGGEYKGVTPLALELEQGTKSLKLDLDLHGYKPISEPITPDRDQRVRLDLVALPKPKPVAPPVAPLPGQPAAQPAQPTQPAAAPSGETPAKKPYKRFD